MPPKRKPKPDKFCPHCKSVVANRTFYKHKQSFPDFFTSDIASESVKRKASDSGQESEFSAKRLRCHYDESEQPSSTLDYSATASTSDPLDSRHADDPTAAEASKSPPRPASHQSAADITDNTSTANSQLFDSVASHSANFSGLQAYQSVHSEFNFKHGYGVLDSGSSNQACIQLLDQNPLTSNETDFDAYFNHVKDTENVRHSVLDSVPVDSSHLKALQDLLTFQMILLACNMFSQGLSDASFHKNVDFFSSFLIGFSALGAVGSWLCQKFPKTLYQLKKALCINVTDDAFVRKVICSKPSCCKLYNLSETYTLNQHTNKKEPKKCNAPVFKRGKLHSYCGTDLLKTTYASNGKSYLIPIKTFCYQSVTSQIERILQRPGYEDACQRWRNEPVPLPDMKKDVQSGEQWQRLQNEAKFFTSEHDLALQFNIDWFKPFKNSNKSIGVIYLVLCNLPREVRYKRENLMIYCIVPSLDYDAGENVKTEPESLNTIVAPLVDELQKLWQTGVMIRTHKHPDQVRMRAALLMNACDSPAARKSSGFLAHSALLGCMKCKKIFTGGVGEKYYGGFGGAWPHRTNQEHRRNVMEIRQAKTNAERKRLESKFGCKDSLFVDLPYFDIVKQTIIDPMHCLFLGTTKSFFNLLVDSEILTKAKLTELTSKMKCTYVSGGCRWIPTDIKSSHSFYNSYQWKEWALCYSLIALQGVIADEYIDVWHYFVQACILIIQPVVSMADAEKAKLLFKLYGAKLEKLFGRDTIKPNQHLQCHMDECIKNFGSPYSFWLYPFERYNGELGDIHTNSKSIEVTLMRKFLETGLLSDKVAQLPTHLIQEHSELFSKFNFSSATLPAHHELLTKSPTLPLNQCENVWDKISHVTFKTETNSMAKHLRSDHHKDLHLMYNALYRSCDIQISDVSQYYHRITTASIGGTHFRANNFDSNRHTIIEAFWPDENGLIDEMQKAPAQVGRIARLLHHKVKLNNEWVPHILCNMQWNGEFDEPHPYKPPCKVHYRDKLPFSNQPSCFMPIQRVNSLCSFSYTKVDGHDCLVTIPHKFHILVNDFL